MAKNHEFEQIITKARIAQQDAEIEKCVKMADEAKPEDWQVARLRIWARQWRASKLAPKKYGERKIVQGDADADSVKVDVGLQKEVVDNVSSLLGQIAKLKSEKSD